MVHLIVERNRYTHELTIVDVVPGCLDAGEALATFYKVRGHIAPEGLDAVAVEENLIGTKLIVRPEDRPDQCYSCWVGSNLCTH